ncbi:MAG: beta-propeller fold lactonase family protein, partial [Chloroflexota bacterium]
MTKQTGTMWVYVGTYTGPMPFVQGKAAGITVCKLDVGSGELSIAHTVTGVTNPSYLVVDAAKKHLYVVEEYASANRETGDVSAFRIDQDTGALTFLNRQPSHGSEPAHISVDRTGRWVLAANYRNGIAAVFPVQEDGGVGPAADIVHHVGSSIHPVRQTGPHAHWIQADATNRFVMVPDLGLDAIVVYRFDAEKGKLHPADELMVKTSPGACPRHAVFRPDNRFLYLVNELDSTFISYAFDAESGQLSRIQCGSTLPDGFQEESHIAAVRVSPNGRFVYAANRGHNSIGIFASDPETGMLANVGHESTQGLIPRDFNIDPTGRFLFAANQDSNTIVTYRIDEQTGLLETTGHVANIDTPVCIEFGALVLGDSARQRREGIHSLVPLSAHGRDTFMDEARFARSAVIGAGMMGPGIAVVLAGGSDRVALFGRSAASVRRAEKRLDEVLASLERNSLLTTDAVGSLHERIRITDRLDDAVRDTGLVIESISEDLTAKQDLFAKLEHLCGTETILASNTSSLRISDIAANLTYP